MAMFDEGLTYKDGHMYQAWIQFKDPSKAVEVDITFPPSDANKSKTDEEKEKEDEEKEKNLEEDSSQALFTIPYWDNVICSMQYSEEYYSNGKLRVGSGDNLLNEEPEAEGLNPVLA